jgi:hypothetical protein
MYQELLLLCPSQMGTINTTHEFVGSLASSKRHLLVQMFKLENIGSA